MSSDIISVIESRAMNWLEHVVFIGDAYRISVGKPEEKSPLGRPRHR
jgi:hypothetical protein